MSQYDNLLLLANSIIHTDYGWANFINHGIFLYINLLALILRGTANKNSFSIV